MADMDFESLLDQDAGEIKRPPLWPSGTYRATITKRTFGKSAKKGTNQVAFTTSGLTPMDDVDKEEWNDFAQDPMSKDFAKDEKDVTFYLTPKAMFRLTDFFEHCGLDKSGPVRKLIDECLGQSIGLKMSQKMGADGRAFNSIDGTCEA